MITVIDSIMGSRKTTWAFNYINSRPDLNFLYITPFLKQITRAKNEIDRYIAEPIHTEKSKFTNLKSLLRQGYDIATTHALFKYIDDEAMEIIRKKNYVLIMDEAFEPLVQLKIAPDDIEDLLLKSEMIRKDDPDADVTYISWNEEHSDYNASFNYLKNLTERKQVICINNDEGHEILIWEYPPKIFEIFKEIYVLTYMFEASFLYYYFNIHNINFIKKSIAEGQIVDYYYQDPSKFTDTIKIYHGSMNINFPQNNYSLSKNWFGKKDNQKYVSQLKKNIYNYFFNIHKDKAKYKMWSCHVKYKEKLTGKGYGRRFVPMNARATNNYQDVKYLAYCINIFMPSMLKTYLIKMGQQVDQNSFALSTLLQWIWRSRIRQPGNPSIHLYLPSNRMRLLLYEWLNVDFDLVLGLDAKHSQKSYKKYDD